MPTLTEISEFEAQKLTYDSKYPLLRYLVAEHGKKLLYGKGYDFNTENQAFKNMVVDWSEQTNLINLLEQAYIISSLHGVVYVVQLDEEPTLSLVSPQMPVFTSYDDKDNLVGISLWRKQKTVVNTYYLQEEYKLDKDGHAIIKRTAYSGGDKGTLLTMDLSTFNSATNQTLEGEVKLPFDYIPVFPVYNKNQWIYNPLQAYKLADGYHATYLENDYISALRNKTGERIKNQTYLVGKVDGKMEPKIRDEQTGEVYDMFLNFDLQSSQGEMNIEIVSSPSKLPEYNNDLNHIKEAYFNMAGYSFQTSEEQAGSDTATGQMLMKGRDIETTLNKRRILQYFWTNVFRTVFPDAPEDLSFVINENISIDSKQLLEQFTLASQLGIMSPAEMRAKYLGISIEQAEEDMERINQEAIDAQVTLTKALGTDMPAEEDNGSGDAPAEEDN